ncbi:MAG: hypothetical protein MHMPM18_000838 [Marteilia pararefringens]
MSALIINIMGACFSCNLGGIIVLNLVISSIFVVENYQIYEHYRWTMTRIDLPRFKGFDEFYSFWLTRYHLITHCALSLISIFLLACYGVKENLFRSNNNSYASIL